MKGIRVPVLMGLTSLFKRFWNLLRVEVGSMFIEFHRFTSLPCIFVSYFVSFIPKAHNPSLLGDFCPISLVGSFYKLVPKVLANRLGMVIDNIFYPNQSTF